MKTRKLTALFLAMAMMLALFAGCSDRGNTDDNGDADTQTEIWLTAKPESTLPADDSLIDYDATVIYNIGWGEPENYANPYLCPGHDLMRHVICSPLVMFYAEPDGTKGMEYILAENVECSSDMTEFTITLREGIKWHDGEPITAHDVVYSATDLWYDNGFLYSMYYGREDQPGVWTEMDERTIHVKYEEPYDDFLTYLDDNFVVAPAHYLEGLEGDELNTYAFPEMPIGSGPFKVVKYNEGEYIQLERFDDYYEPARIRSLRLQFVTEDSVAVLAMQSGDIDITRTYDAITNALDTTDGVTVFRTPELRMDFLMFNMSGSKPYSDPYVRKAYTCLFNCEEICSSVLGYMHKPNSNVFHPNSDVCDECGETLAFSVEQAKAYLEEGGYTLGSDGYYEKDGKRLELDFCHTQGAGSDREKIGLTLQYYAKQAGIYMTVNNYDDESWTTRRDNQEWDIIIDYFNEGLTAVDCVSDFGYFAKEDFRYNVFGEYAADIRTLVDEVKTAGNKGDTATANAKAKELATLVTDNALAIPAGIYVTAYCTQDDVHIEDCCYDELQFLNRIWVEKAN